METDGMQSTAIAGPVIIDLKGLPLPEQAAIASV
jgi:hypothetical protein